uniref:Serpentine receptor class gamma n=1 Tax=Globodera rostochiensis TaxID=31243 RepID=A0A914HU60_GLORO
MDSSLFFSAMAVLANADLFPFLFALVIGIPSAMLYCLELSVIITNFAHFSSPFFVLVVVRTVLSLANYVFAFFAHRFGKIGLFLSVYLQLPRIVCGAVVPIFNLEMFVHVQNDNFTFTLDDHKTENELNSTEIAALSAVFFGIVCFLLNMATLFAYKLRPHSQKPNDQTEHKMTIYTVATFFGQLIMAIFMIFVYMTATNFVDEQNIRYSLLQKWFDINLEQDDILFLANFNQYPWVNDLSTVVIPAWLLLWASTKMQQIVVKKIKFMRCSKRHGGVVVPNFVRFLRIHSAFISREQLAICPWLLYIPQGCHPSLNGKDSP